MSKKLTLDDIKAEFAKHLQFKDTTAIDLVLATILGNTLLRGRIWLLLIGSSGSGKTSIVDPLRSLPTTFFLDDVSPNAFLSAYMGGKQSLLQKITMDPLTKKHVPKTIVFSDFTTILSKNQEARGEILSQFRVIYDGKMDKGTGVGHFKWEGKIGALCCATQNIYNHLEAGRSMGERFTYFVMPADTDKAMLLKQRESSVSPEEITASITPMYYDYCFSVKDYIVNNGLPELNLSPEQYDRIENSAIFCVKSKANVQTDYKTGKALGMPEKASATRDNRAFMTLLHMLHILECHDHSISYPKDKKVLPVSEKNIQIIERCGYSAIPTERRKILEALVYSSEGMTSSQIGAVNSIGVSKESIEKFVAPLHAIGIINKRVSGTIHKWCVNDENIRSFIKKVSVALKEEEKKTLDIFEAGATEEDLYGDPNDF